MNNAATLRKANCKCFINCIMKHHYCSLDYLLLPSIYRNWALSSLIKGQNT